MRLQFVLGDMLNGLRRNLSMTVSVVLVAMVSLFFMGFGLLSRAQVDTMKDYWYDKVEVSIFLCPQNSDEANCAAGEATQAQKDELQQQLNSLRPLVQTVYFESKQEAYTRFKDQFKDSVIADSVTPDQMPESFRVKLSDPQKYAVVASAFQGAPGVDNVLDQRKLLENLFNALGKLTWAAGGFAIAMGVSAVLLVATTVRLSAFSRRREIGIMRLVGASSWVIQLPFVLEAIIATLLGTALATAGLLAVVKFGITDWLAPKLLFFRFIGTGDVWQVVPLLALAGILVAVIASAVTMRRYLRV
ncbi:permease-like cell division protein FtsX [Angustibacter aerolatus]